MPLLPLPCIGGEVPQRCIRPESSYFRACGYEDLRLLVQGSALGRLGSPKNPREREEEHLQPSC